MKNGPVTFALRPGWSYLTLSSPLSMRVKSKHLKDALRLLQEDASSMKTMGSRLYYILTNAPVPDQLCFRKKFRLWPDSYGRRRSRLTIFYER
jgi:hypothetical protein